MKKMPGYHKNKTFAALLAAALGGIGAHRFYIHGMKDFWGWAHAVSLPLTALLFYTRPESPSMFSALPFIASALAGLLTALVVGLTPDEKWDARHNPNSARKSESGWPLAVLLVLTFGAGAVGLIAAIARTFDLLYTGGSFG